MLACCFYWYFLYFNYKFNNDIFATKNLINVMFVFSLTLNQSAQLKVGCDNTVVRMVSSGKFVNRVSFQYRLLGHQELQQMKGNGIEDVCLRPWDVPFHSLAFLLLLGGDAKLTPVWYFKAFGPLLYIFQRKLFIFWLIFSFHSSVLFKLINV